jgi:hypothetical protein
LIKDERLGGQVGGFNALILSAMEFAIAASVSG